MVVPSCDWLVTSLAMSNNEARVTLVCCVLIGLAVSWFKGTVWSASWFAAMLGDFFFIFFFYSCGLGQATPAILRPKRKYKAV